MMFFDLKKPGIPNGRMMFNELKTPFIPKPAYYVY
jgi:hypothetical protein